jgi:hypothetical protein
MLDFETPIERELTNFLHGGFDLASSSDFFHILFAYRQKVVRMYRDDLPRENIPTAIEISGRCVGWRRYSGVYRTQQTQIGNL